MAFPIIFCILISFPFLSLCITLSPLQLKSPTLFFPILPSQHPCLSHCLPQRSFTPYGPLSFSCFLSWGQHIRPMSNWTQAHSFRRELMPSTPSLVNYPWLARSGQQEENLLLHYYFPKPVEFLTISLELQISIALTPFQRSRQRSFSKGTTGQTAVNN